MPAKTLSQRLSVPLLLLFGFLFLAAAVAKDADPLLRPEAAPAPPENQLKPARVHLGQLLTTARRTGTAAAAPAAVTTRR